MAAASAVPGADHPDHSHWLIPVEVADVPAAMARLRAIGIDASGASNVVDLCPGSRLMTRVVFVPAYPELPAGARREILEALARDAPREAVGSC